MLLRKVKIKNFKSIKNLEFDFPESNILILVGENNSGKSNIIRSIDAICGETWYGREKLTDHDHYLRKKENKIHVDLYFDNGRSVNFCPTWDDWGIKYFTDWEQFNRVPFGQPSIKEDYPSTYLGADRTFDKHLSFYDWTLIGRIRKAFHKRITEQLKGEIDIEFGKVIEAFKKVEGFNDFLADFSKFFKDLMPSGKGHMSIDFQPFTPANYFKTMQILAHDPNQSDKPIDVDELGEGARNMILIALLRSYAKNFKHGGEVSGLLALEEPELFLHPQARRHLATVLRDLAKTGIQVIISTHSDSFIDTEFFDSVGRVIKIKDAENEGRECSTMILTDREKLVDFAITTGAPANKVSIDNIRHFYKTTSNHRLNEGFFARCLVLVEGETEELAIPEFMSVVGIDCDAFGISILEVKGKNQIPKYWRLYASFNIPIIVIFDNDNEGNNSKSNQNLATCFGITTADILNDVDKFKVVTSTTNPITDLIVLENDFETALKKDLESQGHQGLYEALETDARNLIKPITKDHQKGAIARLIARGIQDNTDGEYVPEFVVELCELITKKIELN
jgi:putative ATP-dependent endonuclease of the OLD family